MKLTKVLIIVLLAVACKEKHPALIEDEHSDHNDVVSLSKQQMKAIGLTTTGIKEVEMSKGFSTTGFLDVPPGYKARLHSIVPCFIESIKKLEGGKVKKGELLITGKSMEYIDLQKNYLVLKEQLALASLESERQQLLKDVSAQKTLQQTTTALNTTKAEFEAVKNKLKLLNTNFTTLDAGEIQPVLFFYSPINGKVSLINVAMGQYVGENNSLLEVVDSHHLHVELNIYENDIGKIKENQKISIRIPGTNETLGGHVFLKSNILKDNRSVKVHAHFDNEETVEKGGFTIGQFVEVEVLTDTAFLKALPESAVFSDDNEEYAFMVTKKEEEKWTFTKTKVTTGNKTKGYIEVNDSFAEGEEFADQGIYYLINSITETEGHDH